MSASFTAAHREPAAAQRPTGNAWRWGLVAAAGLALVGLAAGPLWPALTGSLTGLAPQTYWYLSRASAFVAFGLLTLSMLAGLGITTGLARRWPRRLQT